MKVKINNHLSLVLLLGLMFKGFPLRYLQPLLQKSMEVMQQKHSAIFRRLSSDDYDFTIDAFDLPFVFYLKPNVKNPVLKAIKRGEDLYTSAVVRGSFANLLKLFEGKLDGDAAFFSKELIIEGSTAAVVALRNAVDGEDMDIIIDLSDLFGNFLRKPFINIANMGYNVYRGVQDNLDTIVDAVTKENSSKILNQELQIQDIFKELDEIQEALKRLTKEQIRKKSDYTQKD